jgi:hypothetical protein
MESESISWKPFILILNPFASMQEFIAEYSDIFVSFLVDFPLPFTTRSRIEKFKFGEFWIAGDPIWIEKQLG